MRNITRIIVIYAFLGGLIEVKKAQNQQPVQPHFQKNVGSIEAKPLVRSVHPGTTELKPR